MRISHILMMVFGYLLLYGGVVLVDTGGLSLMRTRPTTDTAERVFEWGVRSILPLAITAIAGAVSGNSSIVFSAAIAIGAFGMILVFGMMAISRDTTFTGEGLFSLGVFLISCLVLLLFTNFTWSKGHPETLIGRGAGVLFLVLAALYFLFSLSGFTAGSKKEKRTPDIDFVPAVVMLCLGIALAGLGATLFVLGIARAASGIGTSAAFLGFVIAGVLLTIPEYLRLGSAHPQAAAKVDIFRTRSVCNLGMLLMTGIAALISPIHATFGQSIALLISMAAVGAFAAVFWFGKKLGRLNGLILIAVYMLGLFIFMRVSL